MMRARIFFVFFALFLTFLYIYDSLTPVPDPGTAPNIGYDPQNWLKSTRIGDFKDFASKIPKN